MRANLLSLAALALLVAGCATPNYPLDRRNSCVRVRVDGCYLGDRRVEPHEIPIALDDADVPRDRTVHIILDPDVRNLTEARTLMGLLAAAGYRCPVLVTQQHAESEKVDPAAPRAPKPATKPATKSRRR